MIIIQFMNQSLISLSHDKNGKVELMRPEPILFVINLAVAKVIHRGPGKRLNSRRAVTRIDEHCTVYGKILYLTVCVAMFNLTVALHSLEDFALDYIVFDLLKELF